MTATKAAERAREWLVKKIEEKSDDDGYTVLDFPDLLADYEAATIERCAQIAEARQKVARDFAEKFDSANMQTMVDRALADARVAEDVAAAIRSMGDTNGDNK